MSNRPARLAVIAFVLVFPLLMVAASPKGFNGIASIWPLVSVEAMLVAGIGFVARERKRFETPTAEEPTFKLGHVRRGTLSTMANAGRARVSAR